MVATINGIQLDTDGRCIHYHDPLDVVAIKCAQCKKYFACYKCHNKLMHHQMVANADSEPVPVVCGHCQRPLSYRQYQKNQCPFCGEQFNPRCRLHHSIYFKK